MPTRNPTNSRSFTLLVPIYTNLSTSNRSRYRRRSTLVLVVLTVLLSPVHAGAGDVHDADAIPHIDGSAREGYGAFLSAPRHRAFAVAPGGAWGWSDSEATKQRAEAAAVAGCEKYTDQRCVAYAVNDEVVFDRTLWSQLWGPYLDHDRAEHAVTGVQLGQRFPDLGFNLDDGRAGSISSFHDKVVVLHFWGTWCTYCRPELTELQTLYDQLAESGDFEFVLLQVRESYATTRKWMDEQGFSLPQYDSGVPGAGDDELRLADGSPIRDRILARAFPTTYVLDRRGIVVFRRVGPALRWREYVPLLEDVAARSGT